ncbi:hypothetical protein JXO59_07415 [candidate division KSB1 bacterium]|nr:hypothetical protein [candidate division KSB1 bacterium]
MDIMIKEELAKLIEKFGGTSVSIYMPAHRAGRDTEQGPIRLKNLLKKAQKYLLTTGLRSRQIQTLLRPAENLLNDGPFWQYQNDGLALFLSAEGSRYYRLPLRFDELVVVTDRFHIKPLLPLFAADGRFFVLALSKNAIRLLECTRFSISKIDLEDVPTSLAQALRFDEPEKQLQYHTGTSAPRVGRGRPAIFHGHGAGSDEAKSNILRYFQEIDKGLQQLLREEKAPLVLAGVSYLLPIYRESNKYPHLVKKGIEGNPDDRSDEWLHQRAWEIIHPLFMKAQKQAAMQYHRLARASSDLSCNDLDKIVPAARDGRIETLFVSLGVQRWGIFDPRSRTVQLHDKEKAGNEDLLDFAAVHTILTGGTVYALEPENMPDDAVIAAIFRY